MLECINGIDVSAYSDYPEDEVLLMPGAKFEVSQVMPPQMLGGAAMIAMRQVASRHDILTFEPDEPEVLVLNSPRTRHHSTRYVSQSLMPRCLVPSPQHPCRFMYESRKFSQSR
jgi:hypothetical protein